MNTDNVSVVNPSAENTLAVNTTPPQRPKPRAHGSVQRSLLVAAGVLLMALLALWGLPGSKAAWQPPQAQTTDLAQLFPPLPQLDASRATAAGTPRREDQLLLMQERPLFVMGRRPPLAQTSAQAEAAPPPSDQWGNAQVQGTFVSAQATGAFVVLDGQPMRILQGQSVGGGQLVAVQPYAIEIQQGARKRQLDVQKLDLTKPPTATAATAAKGGSGARPAASTASPFAITPQPSAAAPAQASRPAAPAAASPADAATPAPPPRKRPVFGGSSSQEKT